MPPDEEDKYSLLITGLTDDTRAIVSRQEKIETVIVQLQMANAAQIEINKQQIETNKQQAEANKAFAEEMKEIKKEQGNMKTEAIRTSGRVQALYWLLSIAGAIALTALGAILGKVI